MSLQYSRYECRECGKPALHVRSTYDVPHLGHLVFACTLSLAALLTRGDTSTLLGGAAVAWLAIWGLHSAASYLTRSEPYRCQACGAAPSQSQKAI